MDYYIAPSLLSADFERLAEENAAGVAAVRKSANPPLDVHLMIVEPEKYLEAFADAGADVITVHAEATPHLQRAGARVRALGRGAGGSRRTTYPWLSGPGPT